MMQRFLLTLGAFVAVTALGGCGKSTPLTPGTVVPLSSLTISPHSDTLLVGSTHVFATTALDTSGVAIGASVAWRSSNPSVATVTASGRVTGAGEGTALIIASSSGKSDTATVLVLPVARGWFAEASSSSSDLNGVAFDTAGNAGWAVGAGGTILATTDAGAHWTRQVSNSAFTLNAVWAMSATEAWVAGAGGTVLHTANGGATWTRLTSSSGDNLTDVTFTSRDTGFAVGANGAVLRTTDRGVTWVTTRPTTFNLRGVSFAGRQGWAVGDAGVIVGTNDLGVGWTVVQPSVTSQSLHGVRRVSDTVAIAVGAQGSVPHTVVVGGNVYWQYASVGAANQLEGVFMTDALHAYAVGYNGTGIVLASIDGGLSWSPQAVTTQYRLTHVVFVDANRGWAVGANGTILHTASAGRP